MAQQSTIRTEFVGRTVDALTFGFYNGNEVLDLSVKRITNPTAYDNLGNPNPGGVYDPALGPTDFASRCATCRLGYHHCPGHFGHIELAAPVYNTLVFPTMVKLLRSTCMNCHHFKMEAARVRRYLRKLTLLARGDLAQAQEVVLESVEGKGKGDTLDETELDEEGNLIEPTVDDVISITSARWTSQAKQLAQKTVLQFMEKMPTGKCGNCKAHSPAVKVEDSKIFVAPLSRKAWNYNASMGLQIGSVLGGGPGSGLPQLTLPNALQVQEDGDASKERDVGESDSETDDEGAGAPRGHAKGKPPVAAAQRAARQAETMTAVPLKSTAASLTKAAAAAAAAKPKYLTPSEVEAHLLRLWSNEEAMVTLVWGGSSGSLSARTSAGGGKRHKGGVDASSGCGVFFIRRVIVPPNRFRPPSVLNGATFEHAQSVYLNKILSTNMMLADRVRALGKQRDGSQQVVDMGNVTQTWIALQGVVSGLLHGGKGERLDAPGIKQQLEKKEGLFRKHMMGKRVNFACRSVISPDPYLPTCSVGIPPYFATRLTYREPVTPFNVAELRAAVLRGPDVHPGATHIEDESGQVVALAQLTEHKRAAEAKKLLSGSGSRARMSRGGSSTRVGGDGCKGPHATKAVYRHIRDGDIVLVNRQPTLHRPGIMAHTVRVLKGEKTLRLHYANCNTYNADFDGDEMNVHLPQDEVGRAEGYGIVHADQQYLVPTSGAPLRGLIQDHIVSGVLLTSRDTFLTLREFQQCVYVACAGAGTTPSAGVPQGGVVGVIDDLGGGLTTPPPAVLRPVPLWTGKQVLSAVLRHLARGRPPVSFSSTCKVPGDYWGKGAGEGEFIVRGGELVAGVLDKAQFGKHGLVHVVYEFYGATEAGMMLSILSRLFTFFLQIHGFTCGVDDLLIQPKAEQLRAQQVASAAHFGDTVAAEFIDRPAPPAAPPTLALPAPTPVLALPAPPADASGKKKRKKSSAGAEDNEPSMALVVAGQQGPSEEELAAAAAHEGTLSVWRVQLQTALGAHLRSRKESAPKLDMRMSSQFSKVTSEVIKTCIPGGQAKPFPRNMLSMMTVSGAKGSLVNFSQISALLGQQELEGRRVPLLPSGKSLPCFAPYDLQARAGGFIGDRFLSGLRPQEYYFHCMAGRDGLVDTTVKTSRSGYLQRCLVKNLEGLKVEYDFTVRDVADGSVVQFQYGGDSLDITKASFLGKMHTLAENSPLVEVQVGAEQCLSSPYLDKSTVAEYKRAYARKSKRGKVSRDGGAAEGDDEAGTGGDGSKKKKKKRDSKGGQEEGDTGDGGQDNDNNGEGGACDPVMSQFPPGRYLGSVSELFEAAIDKYLSSPPAKALLSSKDARSRFRTLMHLKYQRTLIAPGESVGVLAAQSVGEPSTQMTLNTFHFAGRGEANVTLGIPRLREILMTASAKIKTPVMTLPLRQGMGGQGAALGQRLRRLVLLELVKEVRVGELPVVISSGGAGGVRAYRVTLTLHPMDRYPPQLGLTLAELGAIFREKFIPALQAKIRIAQKRAEGGGAGAVVVATVTGEGAGGGGDGEDDGGDGDARRGKSKKKKETVADDEDDEENEDLLDSTALKRSSRRGEDVSYLAPDEEEEELARDALKESEALHLQRLAPEEDEDGDDDDAGEDGGEEGDDEGGAGSNKQLVVKDSNNNVLALTPASGKKSKKGSAAALTDSAEVDEESMELRALLHVPLDCPKLLMLQLAEAATEAVVVRSVPGIMKCYVIEDEASRAAGASGVAVQTDGVNFMGVWEHAADVVDVDHIRSNDVAAILRTYGVEAARATVLSEVSSVFKVYGIAVDPRHLELIGDFMTAHGGYRACNRLGIDSSPSPLLKISFETATQFLTDATLSGATDWLDSPSASIVMGKPVKMGTGAMGLLLNVGY
eukprot:jgi/Mesvir1/22462/Mv18493-RA.1